jgi:hypothetical protein
LILGFLKGVLDNEAKHDDQNANYNQRQLTGNINHRYPRANRNPFVIKPLNPKVSKTCARCGRLGPEIKHCKLINDSGLAPGCPRCNTMAYDYDYEGMPKEHDPAWDTPQDITADHLQWTSGGHFPSNARRELQVPQITTKSEPSKATTKVPTNTIQTADRISNVSARDVLDRLAESFEIFAESLNSTASDFDYAVNGGA